MRRFLKAADDLFFDLLIPAGGAAFAFQTGNRGWAIFFIAVLAAEIPLKVRRLLRKHRGADDFAKPSS